MVVKSIMLCIDFLKTIIGYIIFYCFTFPDTRRNYPLSFVILRATRKSNPLALFSLSSSEMKELCFPAIFSSGTVEEITGKALFMLDIVLLFN